MDDYRKARRGGMLIIFHIALLHGASITTVMGDEGFLKSTLVKIQQERLNSLTQEDNGNENEGEILPDSENETFDGFEEEEEKFNFENNFDDEKVQQINNFNSLPASNFNNQPAGSINFPQQLIAGDLKNQSGEIQGYYYYFYPLDHYVANQLGSQSSQPQPQPSMDSLMDGAMKMPMNKGEMRVHPLFRAMTWFITTAIFFVISVLLMPRLRVKVGKKVGGSRTFSNDLSLSIGYDTVLRAVSRLYLNKKFRMRNLQPQ